jgi:hypothetical protein
MIPCQKCGHINPLGTSFCRGCGTRLEFDYEAVAASVAGTKRDHRDENVFTWGRSALTLCGFALICALIVRYVMVPPMPLLEYPLAPSIALFPKDAPPWTGATLASGAVAGPASGATAAGATGGPITAWRQSSAARTLSALGVSTLKLDAWVAQLVKVQHADGGFPGDDDLAATALGVLALDAYPTTAATRAAAAKGLAWLQAHAAGLGSRPPLGRTLLALALAEADRLDPTLRGALEPFLIDGSEPAWQALLLSALPVSDRSTQQSAVRGALKTPIWSAYFTLLDGGVPTPDAALFGLDGAKALRSGEDRLVWAATAWADPVAPLDLVAALRTWALTDPLPVAAGLNKAGPTAQLAVAILAVTAPVRLPPLWLVR